MSPDEKQVLVEKIEALSPEQRKRVEGYVDALYEMTQPSSAAEEFSPGSEKEEQSREPASSAEPTGPEEKTLDLSLRGALRHLKDEYTAEELQEKAKQWRIKKALDY
jgi:hypothetical protein